MSAQPENLPKIDCSTPGHLFYRVLLDGQDVSSVCVAASAEEGWADLHKVVYLKNGTLTSWDYKAETAEVRSIDRSAVRAAVHTSRTRYRYALALELRDKREGKEELRPYYELTDDGKIVDERKAGTVVIELRKPKDA